MLNSLFANGNWSSIDALAPRVELEGLVDQGLERRRHLPQDPAAAKGMRQLESEPVSCSWVISRRARSLNASVAEWHMKKFKHEAELFKAALLAGVRYAEDRNAAEFEATDSASDKALYVYRLLVHDRIIAPMPEDQVSEKTIRHRLATWYAHQLPDGHPLLG